MAAFEGLGKALRWLRARQDLRQYQVAEAAGVTKAMLSAYETEKQKPSLETLEKLLDGLGATLGDLHQALGIVRGQADPLRTPEPGAHRGAVELDGPRGFDLDLYRILGARETLPVEEEQAMRQMLLGFHGLLRYMHQQVEGGRRRRRAEGVEPVDAPEAGKAGEPGGFGAVGDGAEVES
jgi:transcriptional regulator with XRE-family HTH domain